MFRSKAACHSPVTHLLLCLLRCTNRSSIFKVIIQIAIPRRKLEWWRQHSCPWTMTAICIWVCSELCSGVLQHTYNQWKHQAIDYICPISRQLTGSRVDPPRYGGHWEEIGFQGTDPATDLRGVGRPSVVHIKGLSLMKPGCEKCTTIMTWGLFISLPCVLCKKENIGHILLSIFGKM